ncbi:MAG TPA: serine/threonine-protein kinase [Planctomycetota bacterium]|nr:serine/threonine-protein kinase [Planctomycetota bacterium]
MKFAHFQFDPVQDLLGEGPLSEVYRAVDEKLERTVALKILRAHVELDPEADERFEREARHTSHLQHPNIATIYEYGEDSGRRYIAMEYLQGRTLDKIIKDQQLGIDEGLRVALQVSSALALVHKRGLIHRDLKPANVMVLHDGTVKLLDFGIARAHGESTITQHGMLVGTVLYMAPEQVRGDELDVRSDIFAFGALCYHALTGTLPFPGTSFPEVCMAILDGNVRPPSQVRPGIPQAVEDFMAKCLMAPPAERYPNAEVAHGVLMAIVDGLAPGRSGAERYLSGSLAIQPLVCTGGEILDGLAASLRKDLGQELSRSGLTVSLAEDDSSPSDFALRGQVCVQRQASAERLDGTLELVLERGARSDAAATELWRESLTHSEVDEWALQAQLVRSAVRALRRQIAEHSFRTHEVVRRDPEGAGRLSSKAHEVLHRGLTKHLLASMSLFRRALEADPRCALAYAGLSEALSRKFLYWDGDSAFLDEAREEARRALSVDPSCAEAHTALGFGYHLSGLLIDAQREYRLAIQLDSDEWLAHRLLGGLLGREGNFKAASPLLQRAIAIRPGYISSYDHLYKVLQRLDRYQEAIETADRGITAARKQLTRAADDQDTRVHLALLFARMGNRDDALAEVGRALEAGPKDGFTAFHVALVHAVLGNPEESLEFLTSAQERGYYIRTEQRSTEFDILRGLPQFQSLVA